jgi:hypothetical protein
MPACTAVMCLSPISSHAYLCSYNSLTQQQPNPTNNQRRPNRTNRSSAQSKTEFHFWSVLQAQGKKAASGRGRGQATGKRGRGRGRGSAPHRGLPAQARVSVEEPEPRRDGGARRGATRPRQPQPVPDEDSLFDLDKVDLEGLVRISESRSSL